MGMKRVLIWAALLIVGYLLGSAQPLGSVIEQKGDVKFETDCLIKAGTTAEQKQSFIKDLLTPIEISFSEIHKSCPDLRFVK